MSDAVWILGASMTKFMRYRDKDSIDLASEAALAALDDGDVSIFDNNPKEMWQKGHVPTAKWVDFKDVKASDLPQDKDRTLVFYCANEH